MNISHPLRFLPRTWKIYHPPLQSRPFPRLFSTSPTLPNLKAHPSPSKSHFKHAPLQPRHIRVLRIHNQGEDSPPDTPISASCTHVSLDANPPPQYAALSYCWGSAQLTHSITLNGHAYPVTSNLHEFLLLMARSDADFTFWIDAVCIEQTDLREREQQVGMMGEVYSKAEFVIAWLGGEGEESGLAFDYAEAAAMREERDQRDQKTDSSVSVVKLGEDDFEEPSGEDDLPPLTFLGLSAFQTLMRRPWFGRIWVVQEVILAKSAVVMCGQRVLGWHKLASGVSVTIESQEYLDQPFEASIISSAKEDFDPSMGYGWSLIPSVRACKINSLRGVDLNISAALSLFLNFQSTDPRDMIYGILGIIDKRAQAAIRPDYTIEVPELYMKATLQCIATDNSLHILALSGIGYDRRTMGLPSWAPDYAQSARSIYDPRSGNSGGTTTVKHRSPSPRKLCLAGYQVDTIDRLGPVWDEAPANGFAPWEWYLAVEALFLQPGTDDDNDDDAFWRTLCKNRATGFGNAPVADGMRPYYEAYKTLNRQTLGLLGTSEMRQVAKLADPDLYAKSNHFARLLYASCLGRRMGATRSGRLGMLPPGTRVGDVVFVALGGHDPLLVRKVQMGEDGDDGMGGVEYQFVGTGYVHGIMDGEVLEMGLEEEELVLV